MGKSVDHGAADRIALLVQPPHHALVEAVDELFIITREVITPLLRITAGVFTKRRAPHLGALLLAQVVEKLHESSHQIGLGEHHIDRDLHTQVFI